MHDTVVFLETSLSKEEAITLLPNATYLPSVKKGDVLKALQEGYARIVIIDGNFSWVPAVWHKEILIALDYGLEVFGAASMGALRAAELDVFGMQGHGRIYEMYKNGEVDSDDEVAISYSKFHCEQTIPLINLRLTLKKITLPNKEAMLDSLRAIFYAQRTWLNISKVLLPEEYQLLYSNYVDAKKEDAKSLLQYLGQHRSLPNRVFYKKKREFTFFEKKLIDTMVCPLRLLWHGSALESTDTYLVRATNLIRLLDIPITKQVLHFYQSLVAALDQQNYRPTESELIYQVGLFREERQLLKSTTFISWLEDRELSQANLEDLFTDYIKLGKYQLIYSDYNRVC